MSFRHAFDLFRGYRTPSFPIMQRRKAWFLLSGIAIALALVGLVFRGLNYSIDFTGGTLILYDNRAGATVEEVRDVLAQAPYGRGEAEVVLVGGNRISIRTTALTDLTAAQRTDLVDELAEQAGVTSDDVSVQVVGPTWGAQITRQAIIGLAIVVVAITVYITFRFEWKMAIGAMAAMIHDVLVTAGVFALTGRQVSPATVIAILTILGFSLYDTVVIYDKVKENTESPTLLAKDTYEGLANLSMNQVLMRSVNTSLVVVVPIFSLLLFGGETLKDFAFAMLVGTITGAYSSIGVATPILVVLKEREERFRQHRARLERRPGAERRLRAVPSPEPAGDDEETGEAASVGAPASRAAGTPGPGRRPGPKSRRRPPAKRKRR